MAKRKVRKRKTKGRRASVAYTRADRAACLAELDALLLSDEASAVIGPLFEEFYEGVEELPPVDDRELRAHIETLGAQAFASWACFDLDEGLFEVMLERARGKGQRAYLQVARAARMRLFEITEVEPGATLTLRDVVSHETVRVREVSGSRILLPGELLAARVFRPGASGEPEMDGGVFRYAELQRPHVLETLREEREAFEKELPDADIWRELPPVLHLEWRTPRMPRMVNFDGDALLLTTVRFDLEDEAALRQAAEAHADLDTEEPGRWAWRGVGSDRADPVTLGWVDVQAERGTVELETNSAERAARGRALLEALAPGALRYRATMHQDLEALRREGAAADPPEAEESEATQEWLRDASEQFMAEHQVKWVDEEVPALEGRTPRQAAKDARLRAALVELLAQFDRAYGAALAGGKPTVDPSWIRDELDVHEGRPARDPAQPPPLPHQRMATLLPGLAELSSAVAARVRSEPGHSPMRSVDRPELLDDLSFQRFVRSHSLEDPEPHADPRTARTAEELVASHAELACNLELHHRKVFWVGEGLSWMLGATRLDVPGAQLRLPFGSFALVFQDRYALGLAERMLSREPACRIRGHLLRALTAYVTRTASGLRVSLACDMLDSGWPYLVVRELDVGDDERLDDIVDSHFPDARGDDVPAIFRCTPLRELLRLVLNTILYATSADAEPASSVGPPVRGEAGPPLESDSVFHLPGKIDIGALRQLKRAVQGSTDRRQVQRCMVRGHWRAAAKTYKDQRARWIAPHWRGPDVAALVEREYRLHADKAREDLER